MANSPGSPLRGEARNALNMHMKELDKLTASKLRERYQELFGSESTSSCRQQLIRRIAGNCRRSSTATYRNAPDAALSRSRRIRI